MSRTTSRPDRAGSPTVAAVLALLVAIVSVTSLHHADGERAAPRNDSLRYLALAWGVHEHGTFARSVPGTPAPAPEMTFMPLYPAFIAAMLDIDEGLRANVECALLHPRNQADAGCDPTFTSVVAVQLALLALALWLIWLVALDLTGSQPTAWASLIAALLCGWPLEFASRFLLEVPLLTFFSMLSLGIVRAIRTGRTRWFVLVGAAFGAMTLAKAVFAYIALAYAACWLALALPRRPGRPERPGRNALAAVLAFAVLVTPWVARNAVLLDTPGLSAGYGAHTLVQRVTYNDMTSIEWVAAFVYWFPDVGDSIARRVFEPEDIARLQRVGERSFYVTGNSTAFDETLEQARARGEDHLTFLLREHVLGNFARHLFVTLPMAWQGIFVSKWWGVLAVLCLLAVLPGMVRARRLDFILFATAPLLALGLHAFVSVSLPRYNLTLIPLLSVCVGIVAVRSCHTICTRLRRLGFL